MALRQDRIARTTQPQGEVGLDPDHWLTPWVRQGVLAGPVRNATRDGRYTTATALQKGVTGQPGVAIDFTGSGGYVAAPSVADSSAWTMISFGVLRAGATVSAVATMAEAPGNSTIDRSLYIGSGGQVGAAVFDGSSRIATTTAAMAVGKPAFIAAVATSSTIGAFFSGELTTAVSTSTGFTGYSTPEFVLGYGYMSGSTQGSNWSAYYTLLIRRALTLAELRELEENPWAILAPDVVEWMLSAGGSSTNLTVSDAAHAHTADNLTLTTSTTLAVADATHGHAADALTLSTGTALVVAEATHAHAADAPTLSVQSALTVADATHAHTADAPVLTAQSALAVADASHGHAADAVTLTTASALAVADAIHGHAADNVVLSVAGATNLTVAEAVHAHAVEALALTSAHALIVADATHGHAVDGLTLTAASVLAIQEALHAHAADGITLYAGDSLLIADALHAHTSDGVALTVAAWLVVADSLHGHAIDNVVLVDGNTLTVGDSLHANAVDQLTLTPVSSVLSAPPVGRVQSAARRPSNTGRRRTAQLSTRTR